MRAGYQRWKRFRDDALSEYGKRRNDAADWFGGSRLSAYLHYGMVSPFRIVREVTACGETASTEKFLDELLIWREMSFHFCQLHSDELDTPDALPDWAGEELRQHRGDVRDETFDWETLARGKTDYALWNASQRSLLKHGELHNNLRMTWGKAFLPMTVCPEQALNHCIDLNHRYALDGRSPASYGGILWCFGQFDRPRDSSTEIFGKVRPRSVESHAQRLDLNRFQRRCDRPIAKNLPRVAIIGAGLAGLIAARTLQDHGLEVQVFDKSRGVGGRLSTRRNQAAPSFDHGAQYFTVRDDRFARYVRSWIAAGCVKPWMKTIVELKAGQIVDEKHGTPRYVGTPAMSSIAKHLVEDLSVSLGNQIARIVRDTESESWQLVDHEGDASSGFDAVIVNCPPEQAAPLLAPHTDLAETIAHVSMKPCWALMLSCDGIADLPYAGAFINENPLSWISRNDAKPGRDSRPIVESSAGRSDWVLHASADWTQTHLEDDAESVAAAMIAGFEKSIGRKIGKVHHRAAHRWRYANTSEPLPQECLWDRTTLLGACGDWCGGPRVEGAFLSGAAMAGTLLRHFTIDRAPAEGYLPAKQETLF
jgi:predicted NAD/FAD-dependent oxidoreductase